MPTPGSIDADYVRWKTLVPFLYDWFAHHRVVWPSLSCRWGAVLERNEFKHKQRLYLSEQTDGSASHPNTLVVCNVDVVKRRVAAAESMIFEEESRSAFVKSWKKIIHPGEVNKMREFESRPELLVKNVQSVPDSKEWNARVDGAGAHALHRNALVAPVMMGERCLGVLILRNKKPPPKAKSLAAKGVCFRHDDISLLYRLATHCGAVFEQALTVEHGRRLETVRRRAQQRTASIMTIAATVCKDVALEDMFGVVVAEAVRVLECDRATMFLTREKGGGAGGRGASTKREIWSKIATGADPIVVPLSESSIAGAAILGKAPVLLDDVYRDPRFDKTWDKKSGYRTKSMLAVPLVDARDPDGAAIGCLQCLNKHDGSGGFKDTAFDSDDVTLASMLAEVVSVAVMQKKGKERAANTGELAIQMAERSEIH
mgnify:CR=1 FL=1